MHFAEFQFCSDSSLLLQRIQKICSDAISANPVFGGDPCVSIVGNTLTVSCDPDPDSDFDLFVSDYNTTFFSMLEAVLVEALVIDPGLEIKARISGHDYFEDDPGDCYEQEEYDFDNRSYFWKRKQDDYILYGGEMIQTPSKEYKESYPMTSLLFKEIEDGKFIVEDYGDVACNDDTRFWASNRKEGLRDLIIVDEDLFYRIRDREVHFQFCRGQGTLFLLEGELIFSSPIAAEQFKIDTDAFRDKLDDGRLSGEAFITSSPIGTEDDVSVRDNKVILSSGLEVWESMLFAGVEASWIACAINEGVKRDPNCSVNVRIFHRLDFEPNYHEPINDYGGPLELLLFKKEKNDKRCFYMYFAGLYYKDFAPSDHVGENVIHEPKLRQYFYQLKEKEQFIDRLYSDGDVYQFMGLDDLDFVVFSNSPVPLDISELY